MNDTFKNVLAFSFGAAIGSAVSWKILKTKYAKMAQEEIDSVKEVFSRRSKEINNEANKKVEEEVKKNNTDMYSSMVENLGYSADKEKEKGEKTDNGIRVISPEEFGDSDYEMVSLTYYADNVLAYDSGEIIEDVDSIVGSESLKCFGEYEDDSVFVRNDALKTDFEILLDVVSYSDAFRKANHSVNSDE